jgi:hypothetical protein
MRLGGGVMVVADSVLLGDRRQGDQDRKITGKHRDRRVVTRSRRPSRALFDGAGGTLRGPPVDVYLKTV